MNISVLLEMAAGAAGDRVLVGSTDPSARGRTAAEVLDEAQRVARAVRAYRADRLGYVGANSDRLPGLLFGAALAGAAYAPVSYRLADDRLRAALARLAPALVVVDGDELRQRIGPVEGLVVQTLDELAVELAAIDDGAVPASAGDGAAVWLFTSGTSGEPKAALLRHEHLSAYVLGTVELLGAGDDEAAMVSVPPYHVAGISALLTGLYRGRRTVLLPSFDPVAWVATARAERITHAMVVPTMLGRILDVLDTDPDAAGGGVVLPHLQHLAYGGGRMPRPIIERAIDLLPHVEFTNAYGLTETSSTVTVLGPDDHRLARYSDDPVVSQRLSSVGSPVPGVAIEVRDPAGTVLVAGEVGEVWVRGEQVSGQYLGGDGESTTTLEDGWFPTRDAGWLDAEGYLYLGGRTDDVIVRGAENLSPGEIEDALIEHPSVADAAVVGVPDAEWGEAVAAVVVPAEGASVDADELRDWVRERLRSSRTPERIEVRAELPYTDTGKLVRRLVRADLVGKE